MKKNQFFVILVLVLVFCLVGACRTHAASFKHHEDIGEFWINLDDGSFVLNGSEGDFFGQITPGTKITLIGKKGRQVIGYDQLRSFNGKRIMMNGDFKVIGSGATAKFRAQWVTIEEQPRKLAQSIVLPNF